MVKYSNSRISHNKVRTLPFTEEVGTMLVKKAVKESCELAPSSLRKYLGSPIWGVMVSDQHRSELLTHLSSALGVQEIEE